MKSYHIIFNESQLREYIDQISSTQLRLYCVRNDLSINFLRQFQDMLEWDFIFCNQKFEDKYLDEFNEKDGFWKNFISFPVTKEHQKKYEEFIWI